MFHGYLTHLPTTSNNIQNVKLFKTQPKLPAWGDGNPARGLEKFKFSKDSTRKKMTNRKNMEISLTTV